MTIDDDKKVTVSAKVSETLRDDAQRNAEHGQISEEIREVLNRIAYGAGAVETKTEKEKLEVELEEVRSQIDRQRDKRRRVDTEIERLETRATRLEERIAKLEEQNSKFDSTVETLETMLLNGGRVSAERIDDDLDAEAVIEELRSRNPEVPDNAFRLAEPGEDPDWRYEAEEPGKWI